MTAAPTGPQAPPRYWIFQARRERYDLAERLVAGEAEEWELNQYRGRVRPGDFVFFWNTGQGSNLMGWGRARHAGERKDSPAISVEYEAAFKRPMDREEFAAQPFLEALTILRTPTGTNFRVTTLEARRIVELLRERGENAPPEPERFAEGAYPYGALQELRLGDDVEGLVGGLAKPLDPKGVLSLDQLTRAALRQGLGDKIVEQALRVTKESGVLSMPATETVVLPADADIWFRVGLDDGCLEAFELARRVAIATTRRESTSTRHLIGALLVLPRMSTSGAGAERVDQALLSMDIGPDGFRRTLFSFLEKESAEPDSDAWGRLARGYGTRPPAAKGRPRPDSKSKTPLDDELPDDSDDSTEQASATAGTQTARNGTDDVAATDETETARAGEVDGAGQGGGGAPGAEADGESDGEGESGADPDPFSNLLLRPPILSDRAQAEDFLDLKDEHQAFARLLADENTELPLAVGLFGHWGAGKTTFLENLEREIRSRNNPTDPGTGFHVAQIELNAWHYMESDVWASFADHIFRSLDREIRIKRKEQAELETLISELEKETRLESRLQRQLDDIDEELESTSEELAEAKKDEEEKRGTFRGQRDAFLSSVGSETTRRSFLNLILEAEKRFGSARLGPIRAQVGQATASFERLGAEMSRVREFAASLGKPTTGELLRKYWWVALMFVGLGGVLYFLVQEYHAVLAGALSAVITVLGTLLSRAPLVGRWLDAGAALRDQVEDSLERLEQDQTAAILANPKLKELRDDQEKAQRKRSGLERDLTRCRDRKAELEEQLEEKPPEERVLEFIKTRAETTDYNKRLGTLALVRRDFRKLSELLIEQHRSGSGGRLPSLRRIVLYIDDLDRCPRERVMAVLEAVHLLLAFPLFAVVVAVDARWVRRSVTQHIAQMDRGNGRAGPGGEAEDGKSENGASGSSAEVPRGLDGRATPQEYLEKIIQIPFWLKPLEGGQRADLLISMLQRRSPGAGDVPDAVSAEEDTDRGGETGAVESETSIDSMESTGAVTEAAVEAEGQGGQSAVASEDVGETPATESTRNGGVRNGGVQNGSVQNGGATPETPWARFHPRRLTRFETQFFPVLDPLLGRTPRSVKPYLSLYGVCRAFRPETEQTEFSGEHGQHRGVQLLYALQTGWPELAFAFFRMLVARSDHTDFFELVAALDAARKDTKGTPPPEFEEASRERWDRLFDALGEARRAFEKIPGSSSLPIEVNSMQNWLPFVTRFAFEDWSPSRHAF